MSEQRSYFAAGCFWGVEQRFRRVRGVIDTSVGYMGGHTEDPDYRKVCTGRTGHAETVEVIFDDDLVRFRDLVKVFWGLHDPTSPDGQGPDRGSQYRSAIFYVDDRQLRAAEESRDEEQGRHHRPIVTEIEPAGVFWRAEEYHQRYLDKHDGSCHL